MTTEERTAPAGSPTKIGGPASPSQLGWRSWWGALRRTVTEFNNDNLTDWAAALTYYGILSLFPGLLVLIAALRLTGAATTQRVLDGITGLAPGAARDVLSRAADNLLQGQKSTAGLLALVGLAGALWSSSGYVGAFMRASNVIYDVPEGRPLWKTLPIRLALTVATGVCIAASAGAIVLTGGVAEQLGAFLGIGEVTVLIWDIAKWPVLVVLISLVFALLYWASPNAQHRGFRWISPGSVLAVVVWLASSAGFALYVTNFGSYNKTYGSVASVIIFLIWLWLSNIAVLLGAELEAELQRARAAEGGHPLEAEPYMKLRDTRAIKEDENRGVSPEPAPGS